MNNNNYQPIIGLEVHVELMTKSKMFCSCSAEYFGREPNTHACPVCLGLPGALPVPNKPAIEWCLKLGLALNCEIPLFSKFDRKNYFYPDLPKGYQISQYDQPFAINGSLELRTQNSEPQTIRIRRVHLEEDTAKLIHRPDSSLLDFNRSGVPLVEIVTEPDFETAEEVVEYLKKLQQIVRYLEISNADMEKGEMRLEPNISLRKCNTTNTTNKQISNEEHDHPRGGRLVLSGVEGTDSSRVDLPGYKVEIKNINSFRFVERAINFEIERQRKLLENGETPVQETRGWSEEKQMTLPQRGKEAAHDYRYFPEPDIPPLQWRQSQIAKLKAQIGELPEQKFSRFQKEYGLSAYDAEILTRDVELAAYFEEACLATRQLKTSDLKLLTKSIANWIINKKVKIEEVLPAQLIQMIIASTKVATIDEKELEKVIGQVLLDNPQAVSDYKKGKTQALMFLTGAVMRQVKGQADSEIIKKLLEKNL